MVNHGFAADVKLVPSFIKGLGIANLVQMKNQGSGIKHDSPRGRRLSGLPLRGEL